MLGASCSPCCTHGDCPGNRPITDPKDEGSWVPSGEWPNVTWTFVPNPGDESGETWFFYGSQLSSGTDITSLDDPRITDWYNICNWYSTGSPNRVASIDQGVGSGGPFSTRAARLPDINATVHVYTAVSTQAGPTPQVRRAYFWQTNRNFALSALEVSLLPGSTIIATDAVHELGVGSLFLRGAVNRGEVIGGAAFGTTGATTERSQSAFFGFPRNDGVVQGGAVFGLWGESNASVFGIPQDIALNNGSVEGGALFKGVGTNRSIVSGGAIFFHRAPNESTVNDGAVFNDFATNLGTVDGGAVFNDFATNNGTVNDGAVFNDAACSRQTRFDSGVRRFVTHPTDLPTCNGTAPSGSVIGSTCGCN